VKNNTWVELNLGALTRNVASLVNCLKGGQKIIFVVKANAYGHGLAPIARQAWESGVRWFAVAHLDEALALRSLLPPAEILVLGRIAGREAPAAAAGDLIPVLVDPGHARELSSAMPLGTRPLRCHAKIDTGMGRMGFDWESAGVEIPAAARLPGLRVDGLCSHFASSAAPDRRFADEQFQRFRSAAAACESSGLAVSFRHVSNSGGIQREVEWQLGGVRPGLLLYGYPSIIPTEMPITVEPVLEWKTTVVQVKQVKAGFAVSYDSTYRTPRETVLATLDVGYADGYVRALSNKGTVLLGGRACPVAGRVTMNMLMVDAGPASTVQVGDEAVLLGRQGSAAIWADELATQAGTIPYEILTGIRTDNIRVKKGR
jgi:alanine racemase